MKTDKHYISEIDKRLAEFDQTHPKSPSQQAEIDKHQRVFEHRDYPAIVESQDETLFEE